jgi:hypothetical protein
MTGVALPASMSSFGTTRSSLLCLTMNGRSVRLTNRDRMGTRKIWRSKPPSHRPPPSRSTMQHLGADAGRCIEERPHGGPVGRRKCDVGLAESLAGGLRADPEFRRARSAEPDDLAEVHHPGSAEHAEHGVVEHGAGAHVRALNGQVIKRAASFTADPWHRVLTPHHGQHAAGGVSCRLRSPVHDKRSWLRVAGIGFGAWRRRLAWPGPMHRPLIWSARCARTRRGRGPGVWGATDRRPWPGRKRTDGHA